MRHIDGHGLSIKLFSVGGNQSRHLAAFDILYGFLTVRLQTSIDITN